MLPPRIPTPARKTARPSEPAPAVCRAGEFQFAPSQRHVNGCVQSRGIFWCKSGHGTIRVNGREFALEPHDLFILPWNRRIEYVASKTDPMFTAHVHLVPWVRPGSPWLANVPHERDEPGFDSPDRSDLVWHDLEDVVRFRIETEGPIARLMHYTSTWFNSSRRAEIEARALGQLWWSELGRRMQTTGPSLTRHPEELKRLMVFIDRNFAQAPTVEHLARILGRSRSHVLKLFQVHLGSSAKAYILRRQINEARDLLLSTTLPVGEVGSRSGLPDPYHFSKLFRRMVGMSPRDFRAQGGPLPQNRAPSTHRATPPEPTKG